MGRFEHVSVKLREIFKALALNKETKETWPQFFGVGRAGIRPQFLTSHCITTVDYFHSLVTF